MSSQIYKEASTYVFFTSLQETKFKHNMLLVIADELREQMKERAGNEGKNLLSCQCLIHNVSLDFCWSLGLVLHLSPREDQI